MMDDAKDKKIRLHSLKEMTEYFGQGLEVTRLHCETMPIFGGGQITLWVPFSKNPNEIIQLIAEDDH